MRRPRRTDNNAGFTMLELMIAMGVLAIAMVGIYSLFSKSTKAHLSQEITLELTQELRAALNLMTTEIRMAGYDPEDNGSVGFLDDADDRYDTDTNSIRFTLDLDDGAGGDPDGDASDPGEDVNYFVDANGNLIRRVFDASGNAVEAVAAQNITNLAFTYLDGDNNPTATLANIRSVDISLTGETSIVDPLLHTIKARTETARIKVRNMGL